MKDHALSQVAGGFTARVDDCKAAYQAKQITRADILRFKADHGYRGKTAASQACFGAAAWGAFGFTESQVEATLGYRY